MSAAELNEYTLERVKTNTCAYQELLRTAPVTGEDATAIELACDRLRSYLDLQLQRLHDWAEGPVDLLALVQDRFQQHGAGGIWIDVQSRQ